MKNPPACLHFANNTPCVVTRPYITAAADTTSFTLPQQCAVSSLELIRVTRRDLCVCVSITTITDNMVCVAGGKPSSCRPAFQPALNSVQASTGSVLHWQSSSSRHAENTARKLWDEYERKRELYQSAVVTKVD